MAKRKTTSFSFQRLLVLGVLFVGLGIACWYLFIKSDSKLQPLPLGFASHGIDVSHHQGEINWDAFFEEMDTVVSFVYYKVSEGTHFIDSEWKRNRAALSKHKVKHGAYHFFQPNISAEKQAIHFLNQYSPNDSELPPVLDAEIEASSNDLLIQGMKTWLTYVEKRTHIKPVIYTSYSMYRDKMKGHFEGYQFWIASYNSDQSRVQDEAIIHWQYSDRGNLPGINGSVDLNFSKQSFLPAIEYAD